MKITRFCIAALLATTASTAIAAPNPELGDCVDLGPQHEVVRAGSGQSFLLRDGDAHYKVNLRGDCSSLAMASSITIATGDTQGRLCPVGSTVKTNRATCTVAKVETLTAEDFATGKRRARR